MGKPLIPGSTSQETSPTLSPDGRWIAYAGEESGRKEVYIRPFPNTESAKYQVSRHGGLEPMWSHSGREPFFRQPDRTFASATIAFSPAPTVTAVNVLFHADLYAPDPNHRGYDVTADDQSFLFIKDLSVGAPLPLHLTTNVGALYQLKRGK